VTRELALSRFKQRLAAGELALGMQHNSDSAAIVELLGYTGFDFVILDMEHSGYSIGDVERLVRAAEAVELAAFVRVLHKDAHLIMQALETGAQGIMVPHVSTRADCEEAHRAVRYPPAGRRGKSAASRAARWGTADWGAYERWANEEVLLIPILEDREAVENMEEIVSVPGLEVVALGPGDLSHAYGAPGEGLSAEPVMDALRRLVGHCRERGLHTMTIPSDRVPTAAVVDEGASVIWHGGDLNHVGQYFLQIARDAREATRAALSSPES
jgi:2-keto-3-deoxy-L-rhamnonate aldolase RhmA